MTDCEEARMVLGTRQLALLKEALRRYTRFNEGKSLTDAWTGLGSATEYAPAANGGYMEIATSPNPGYMTWWRLTPKGAAIVQSWLDAGEDYCTVEAAYAKARGE